MAWVDITAPQIGEATKKVSFADAVIGNLVYLKANMGSSSGGGSAIPNGDFAMDGDVNGVPDGYDVTEYTAGAFGLNTSSPGYGATGIKFSSPGASGGGDLQTTDFFPVSPRKPLIVDFLTWATNPAIHNLVEVRFYSAALEANYISAVAAYDSVVNPTAPARFKRIVAPPENARFAKLKLIGAQADTTEVGTAYFDAVAVTEGDRGSLPVDLSGSTGYNSWQPVDTCSLPLPVLSANGLMRLTFVPEGYIYNPWDNTGAGEAYFSLDAVPDATTTATIHTPASLTTYANLGMQQILVYGSGGTKTMTMYLKRPDDVWGGSTVYARMVNAEILVEVLIP